jgi:hypothetical protein
MLAGLNNHPFRLFLRAHATRTGATNILNESQRYRECQEFRHRNTGKFTQIKKHFTLSNGLVYLILRLFNLPFLFILITFNFPAHFIHLLRQRVIFNITYLLINIKDNDY